MDDDPQGDPIERHGDRRTSGGESQHRGCGGESIEGDPLSAAVTLPTESDEDAESTAAKVRAEMADLRAATTRAKARAVEARAAEDEPDPDPGGFLARIERFRVEHEQHAAACVETFCARCGRHACMACRAVRVDDYDTRCLKCAVERAIRDIELPKRYQDAYLNVRKRVRSKAAVDLAEQHLSAPKIVFRGHIGSGKTTLMVGGACARTRHRIKCGERTEGIMFVSAIDLEIARSQHRLGSGAECELVAYAIDAGLLLIDDLGAESHRGGDVITAIVHARHDADLPMWISTGLSAADIAARYSGGVERRLFEGAVLIDCGGTN